MSMNTLPIGLFERSRITKFRTIPVIPSPKAMNRDGMIASQGSPTSSQIRVIEAHHMKVNLTSFWFWSVWNQNILLPLWWAANVIMVSSIPHTRGYQ